MKNYLFTAIILASSVFATSCGSGEHTEGQPSAQAKAHAAWRESLTDSIDSLTTVSERMSEQMLQARQCMDSLAGQFDVVDNPVLVEKYRVLRGWRGYDSTSGTGILARLLEDNSLELVATHSGRQFSQITFSSGGKSVTTEAVSPDQANNYRIGSTSRVAFTGAKATDAARFVAEHESEPVSLTFVGRGKSAKITLLSAQKHMIATTWKMLNTRLELDSLERRLPIISSKIELFRSETSKTVSHE